LRKHIIYLFFGVEATSIMRWLHCGRETAHHWGNIYCYRPNSPKSWTKTPRCNI